MHKDTKWAKEIISLQKEDGSWGYFHTLSEPKKYPVTTEQALRRLQILGYSIEDEPIQKAVDYLHNCLVGKIQIPDRREKHIDWNLFLKLMFSTWIRRFTKADSEANEVAKTWASLVSFTFRKGQYCLEDYLSAYYEAFSLKAKCGRMTDFVSFYQVSIIADCLDAATEAAVFDYIMNKEDGIYYIYSALMNKPPIDFASKTASRYMGAIELMTAYKNNLGKLAFVSEWLNKNKNADGKWDMGSGVKDSIYFPLSDSWRNKETRISDCTLRIERLLSTISGCSQDK